ncbi:hypothetical protein [uncultured Marixanthomonas sp.]|uniref:hypothetical protein n=1 Tax=uncultured Marixanthomonas sp. TaxID=757245 RepID=UPI0030D7474B|tara:strand:- start:39782 stop:40414 length:633 start_codon:yes stop_codon:yes gene_type:complete
MRYILIALTIFIFFGCSTSKMVNQWKDPATETFSANKVLVVGMTAENQLRRTFETELAQELEKNDMIAVRSIDFFESSFNNVKQSEADLNMLQQELLEKGFDAILLSKITGQYSKVIVVQAYRSFAKPYQSFRDYYYSNQHIYQREQSESYRVYISETSLFCICQEKERELLWRGQIDIPAPSTATKGISDFIKTLINALKEEQILISSK